MNFREAIYREALLEIVNPLQAMQRRCPNWDDKNVRAAAYALARDPDYLSGLASDALVRADRNPPSEAPCSGEHTFTAAEVLHLVRQALESRKGNPS